MSHNEGSRMHGSGRSKMPWLVLIIVVVVLAVVGVLFRDKLFSSAGGATAGASNYDAVFLTNGQVYFGKLTGATGQYVTLNDIFYLQVSPAQGSNQNQAQAQAQQLTLIKLGSELHGPIDEMKINRDQILFYEALKKDGQVVKKIEEYKANPAAATAAPQAQQPQQAAPAAPQQAAPPAAGAVTPPAANPGPAPKVTPPAPLK